MITGRAEPDYDGWQTRSLIKEEFMRLDNEEKTGKTDYRKK